MADAAINNWIRVIFGAALLPSEVVQAFLTHHLENWPQPQTVAINDRFRRFGEYVQRQWIPTIALWNQRGNEGPRTTNHAEG